MRPRVLKTQLMSVWLCALLSLVLLTGTACTGMDWDQTFWQRPVAYEDPLMREAELLLISHDVRGAQSLYAQGLLSDQPPVVALSAVGKSLTDLMLLADVAQARALLTDHLGAERKNYDLQRLLWSSEGLLYWFSQSVGWADQGAYLGVRSLVADKLPWSIARLDSVEAFCSPLDKPASGLLDQAVLWADALEQVQRQLKLALDSSDYVYFYLPGQLFHDERMTLIVKHADLAALDALISAARGLVYTIAAYDHPWTLERACAEGAWRAILQDPAHPEHDPALTSVQDYVARYMNARLGRAVRASQRLTLGRQQLDVALERLELAMSWPQVSAQPGVLRWSEAQPQQRDALLELVQALRASLREPTRVPGTTPALTLHLGALFDGRTLDASIDWLRVERSSWQDERGQLVEQLDLVWQDDAFSAWTRGVASPSPWEQDVELSLMEQGQLEELQRAVLGPLLSAIQDAYGL